MNAAHQAPIPPGVAVRLVRGNRPYASTGLQGAKRQRLCILAQAKSRRRSTQGIVSPDEPAKPEPTKSNGAKPDWVRYRLRSAAVLAVTYSQPYGTLLHAGTSRKTPKTMRKLQLYYREQEETLKSLSKG